MEKYIVVFIIVIAYSCSPKIAPTTQKVENMIKPEILLTDNQKKGKQLFEANCGNCHDLHKPSDFKAENWKPILKRMHPNTDLDDEQIALVSDYLTSGI